MHDRVTICGGVLGGHPRLVADEILALSVANCRSTWRWRDGSRAKIEPHRKAPWDEAGGAIGKVGVHACAVHLKLAGCMISYDKPPSGWAPR